MLKYLTLDSVKKKTVRSPSSPFNPFGRRVEPVERATDWPPVLPPNPYSPIPDIRSIINNPTLFHLVVYINPGRGCFNAQLCQRVISLHYHRFALVITVVIIIITSCFNLKWKFVLLYSIIFYASYFNKHKRFSLWWNKNKTGLNNFIRKFRKLFVRQISIFLDVIHNFFYVY